MSRIRSEIQGCMSGQTITDSIITSNFMFPSDFIGFQGHFPTGKVLPGACQIQCVISTIEKALEKRVALKDIMLAKYIAPVYPGDNVICSVSGVPVTGIEFICRARISKGSEKVSDLKLRVCLGETI